MAAGKAKTAVKKKIERGKQMLNRRRFVQGTVLGTMGFCTACAVDALGVEPEWVEVVEMDLPIGGLPEAFEGTRLVHISDLHLSRTVSEKYLRRCMRRINALEPDMVALTGDYVTLDATRRSGPRVVDVISELRAELGVYLCLGNHDYGIMSQYGQRNIKLLTALMTGLNRDGFSVLRNRAVKVARGDASIWMVGLGDHWAKDMDAEKALGRLGREQTRIVLAHNPDSVEALKAYKPDLVLSGHTHGGQVKVPFLRPPILPVKNRDYYAGLFEVDGMKLYVNRGLGRLGRILFNCRPEITVFTLRGEQESQKKEE